MLHTMKAIRLKLPEQPRAGGKICTTEVCATDLEDVLEESPQGSHEQENDTNGVADTAGF